MIEKHLARTTFVRGIFAAFLLVSITLSSLMVVIVSADTSSQSGSLTENETTISQVSPVTNSTSQSTIGNSTGSSYSESESLEALSRVSHPKVHALPQESYLPPSNTIQSQPSSEVAAIQDYSPIDSEPVATPNAVPNSQPPASSSEPISILQESPQPALAPPYSSKTLLTESLSGVAIIIVATTIAIAVYLKRKKD